MDFMMQLKLFLAKSRPRGQFLSTPSEDLPDLASDLEQSCIRHIIVLTCSHFVLRNLLECFELLSMAVPFQEINGGFHKLAYPKWMVYNGKSN